MEEKLILENMRLAYWVANGFRSTGADLEELQATALLGLVKAAKSYQPEKGTKFNTYAVPVMKGEILKYLKKERRQLKACCSLQDEVLEGCLREETIPDDYHFEQSAEDRIMLQEVMARLTERERCIVRMVVLDNMTQTEAGIALGVSQTHVSRILKRIRERERERERVCVCTHYPHN